MEPQEKLLKMPIVETLPTIEEMQIKDEEITRLKRTLKDVAGLLFDESVSSKACNIGKIGYSKFLCAKALISDAINT